jgi:hypothetical protein
MLKAWRRSPRSVRPTLPAADVTHDMTQGAGDPVRLARVSTPNEAVR